MWIWFVLTALSAAYVAYDLFARTPAMKVMKWGWVLVTLYTGPVAALVYWVSCREPAPYTHERFVAPTWKQAMGSTIHCLAGDATGIIVAAAATAALRLPMGLDVMVEYITGFVCGLFIFQALFMKDMLGGGYWHAVKSTWLAEWLSMNAVMAGMFPVMIIWMSHDMAAMEPAGPRFWFVMSVASLVGAIPAYPVNNWLVARKLKHGMGTERALGRGGAPARAGEASAARHASHEASMGAMEHPGDQAAPVSRAHKAVASLITVGMLAGGLGLAASFGDLSMRPSRDHDPHGTGQTGTSRENLTKGHR